MINQNFENITQSGTAQTIDVEAGGLNFSEGQGYCIIGCITLIIVVSLVMTTRLIQTMILRINFITPKIKQALKEEILRELK